MENKKKIIYIIEDDVSINHGIELTLIVSISLE